MQGMNSSRSKTDMLWESLNEENFRQNYPNKRPLLGHYTTIEVLESIVKTSEIWFSNPLQMNDYQELSFGMREGLNCVLNNIELETALSKTGRHHLFIENYRYFFEEYDQNHVADTFVLCFSEHKAEDYNGKLSMWRGYGSNGNGACVVIDTSHFILEDDTPLIFSKVEYAEDDSRVRSIERKIESTAKFIDENDLSDEDLTYTAKILFESIKLYALFSKNIGFNDEEEWRIVYMPEKDTNKRFSHLIDYHVFNSSIQPKLKFVVKPFSPSAPPDFSLSKIVERIIVGPCISSVITHKTIEKMLIKNDKASLVERLFSSEIPYRVTR